MTDVKHLPEHATRRDSIPAQEILPLVYDELRRLAAHQMSNESAEHTLQPTALVHEAWLRLGSGDNARFANRVCFFNAAAEAMRRILVDRARQRNALKRGGAGVQHEVLSDSPIPSSGASEELLRVHELLDQLAAHDAPAADLVKLRYFAGLTMAEAAEALDVPLRTAERLWSYARAWLRREMAR